MAGDWIKVEHGTPDKPEIIAMAELLGMTAYEVFGRLFRVWSWFDLQTMNGNAVSVSGVTLMKFIDAHTATPGMAASMKKVGWLSDSGMVNFEYHNGESAKKRAVTQKRVKKHRNAQRNAGVTLGALPEKRREEVTPREELRSSPVKGNGGLLESSTPTNPTASQVTTGAAWSAYESAYFFRYRSKPVRNARVNGQMAKFVRLVGGEESGPIAEFYLAHNDARYVKEGHSVGMLVAHAEKLRTEWATGRRVTVTAAQQGDKLQATGDVFTKLIQEAHESENP